MENSKFEGRYRRLSALDPQKTPGRLSSMRQVIIYPGEDGFWVAECPSLPGCISQGETRERAIANIREAIEGYILTLQDDKLPIPEEHFDALLVAV
jgi:predicted RNase H-like HicB family nuclease